MSQGESIAHLEESTIQPIPLTERHGSAKDLFTIWFGSNIMMLTIVTGSLATTVFKQPFWWAALATLVGSLIGAVWSAGIGGCESKIMRSANSTMPCARRSASSASEKRVACIGAGAVVMGRVFAVVHG